MMVNNLIIILHLLIYDSYINPLTLGEKKISLEVS